MSEPTYRIELQHDPSAPHNMCWRASVHAEAEYDQRYPLASVVKFLHEETREEAFTAAQTWCKAKAAQPLTPSTVFLSEEGEIIDPHDHPLRAV